VNYKSAKHFENVNLNVLMSILEEKIQDRRFTDLIRKALNAGHFNYDLSNFSSLHPILIDIF
jgi:retron-type reverse transcriptase